jgi:hypothetical protein
MGLINFDFGDGPSASMQLISPHGDVTATIPKHQQRVDQLSQPSTYTPYSETNRKNHRRRFVVNFVLMAKIGRENTQQWMTANEQRPHASDPRVGNECCLLGGRITAAANEPFAPGRISIVHLESSRPKPTLKFRCHRFWSP